MSFDDEDSGERVLSNAAVLKFLAKQWMRRPKQFAVVTAFQVAATICDILMPLAAGALIDGVTGPITSAGAAWLAFAQFAALWALYCISRNTMGRVMTTFATANMRDMVSEAFAKVQTYSSQWHSDTFAGATVRKLSRGMWAYDTLTDVVFWILTSFAVLAGLSIIMLIKWPLIGLYVTLVCGAFIFAAIWLSENYTKKGAVVSNRLDSRVGGALADAIGNNAAVKSFGVEARENERFYFVIDRWRRACTIAWYRFTNAWLVSNLLLIVLQSGLLALLISQWAAGKASPGDVAFAISSFLVMSGHLRNFGEHVQMIQRGLSEIEDIAIFDRTPAQIADAQDAKVFEPGKGEIVFDAVRFAYNGQSDAIYDDVSLRIAPGETVALVGPTGAGKSTFVRLIQRLYDVDAGRILIDGQDVKTVGQSSLRQAVAVVPQDPALFHRSIADNIAYARPEAAYEDVVAAATRARAHGFVAKLPKGYRTLVGERGIKLSGGERQRVALARAFLANAPVLILDEATSSLDTETEREVQEAMAELKRNRTTIVIAHRLSTVREADRILVFDQGRIVEQGRHADLVAMNGLYARLHAMSQGDVLSEVA